jgi:hypothetical protein
MIASLLEIIREPLCLIDLTVAALHMAAILTLLYRHRWMWIIDAALALAHIAAAFAHGAAPP